MNNSTLNAFAADQISNLDEVTGGASLNLNLGSLLNANASVNSSGINVTTTGGVNATANALGINALVNIPLNANVHVS